MKLFILILSVIISLRGNSQQWYTFANEDSLYNPGGYALVYSLYADDGVLYAGGGFRKTGVYDIPGIVKWNGSEWIPMGSGIYWAEVVTIEKFNNQIYVGGYFPSINGLPNSQGIGRFNGSNWEALPNSGGSSFGWPMTIETFDSDLAVGGAGFTIGTTTYWRITAYNGTDFLYYGSLPEVVMKLQVYNNELYAGGAWYTLKKKNLNSWVDVGTVDEYVQDMDVDTFNNFLYVGGGFNTVNDTLFSNGVAIWNGFYWEKIGPPCACWGDVMRVKWYNGNLYAGLATGQMNCNYTGFVVRWDGQAWHPVADTIKWPPQALEVYKDTLYVGGGYYYESGINIGTLGKWYMPPDTSCFYLQPRVFALNDTFYLSGGHADVQFYNNNAYANTWQWDFGDSVTDIIKDPIHSYTTTGTYNVTITVSHNTCTKTAQKTITIINGNGFEEYSKEKLGFKLYPNPTKEDIEVEVTLPKGKTGEIRIYSRYGSLIEKKWFVSGKNNVKIITNNWPTGVSLCCLYVDGMQIMMEKLIKQ